MNVSVYDSGCASFFFHTQLDLKNCTMGSWARERRDTLSTLWGNREKFYLWKKKDNWSRTAFLIA